MIIYMKNYQFYQPSGQFFLIRPDPVANIAKKNIYIHIPIVKYFLNVV